MPRPLQLLVAPLIAGLTYRRYVHLLLGAVLLVPYVGLVALFVAAAATPDVDGLTLVILVPLGTAAAIGVALVPGVRTLEITAARALFGAQVPEPDPATMDAWPARRRAAAWLLLNMVAGGVVALVTFFVVPTMAGFLLAPWRDVPLMPTGWGAAWLPVVGLLLPVVLLHAVSATGGVLARLAPRLLGPSASEHLATELARSQAAERALAQRNRLARELHDSVGHALTVTTLQAGAAARVLDSDPAFVARALEAIAEAGRTALDELDHVLGLLRDGEAGADAGEDAVGGHTRAPRPDLDDLDALLEGARSAGVRIDAELPASAATVPPAVSREAYRIVQEGLTNALRHAGPVPVGLRVTVGDGALELELTNPLEPRTGPVRGGGGRGLAGVRERVGVLGGTVVAGPESGSWRVVARIPLAGRP